MNKANSPTLLFWLFAATLLYGILFMGMPIAQEHIPDRQQRDIFLVAIGLLGTAAGVVWGKITGIRNRGDKILLWAAIGIPCYVLFQLIPLPVTLVGLLSPARGELLHSLEPLFGHKAFASLSIVPSLTFSHFLLISAYCITLLAAREFTIRAGTRIWLLAAPLVLGGVIESAMALIQLSAGAQVRGTFGIRNHLAGFLEMVVPLAGMCGVAMLRGGRRAGAVIAFAITALLLGGAFSTSSRGGFVSILASALIMTVLSAGREMPMKKRLGIASLLVAGILLGFVFFTAVSLVSRLGEHSSEGRTSVWREGLGVVREYAIFGCGMGGFESAFVKFKASEGTFLIDYAHNDYLQLFAELGIAGFLIPSLLAVSVIIRSFRITGEIGEARWMGLACLGSFTAIAVHSAVDFNLYVAANAAVLAWICGIAAGLTPSAPRLIRRRKPVILVP